MPNIFPPDQTVVPNFSLRHLKFNLRTMKLYELLGLIACEMQKAKTVYVKSQTLDPQFFGEIFVHALLDHIRKDSRDDKNYGKISFFTAKIICGIRNAETGRNYHPIIDLMFPPEIDDKMQAYVFKNLIFWTNQTKQIVWPGLNYFLFLSNQPLAIVLEPYNLSCPLESLCVDVTRDPKIIKLLTWNTYICETDPRYNFLCRKDSILIRSRFFYPHHTDIEEFRKIHLPPWFKLNDKELWFRDSYQAIRRLIRKTILNRLKALKQAMKDANNTNFD